MEKPLSKEIIIRALTLLEKKLKQNLKLILGGGGAMILAHKFPLSTTDVDAIPKGLEINELDPLVKEVAIELELSPDWLNPYFSSFSYTLPSDYESRLVEVFNKGKLIVLALGKEEMLIMKCFAHRPKDVGHAKQLLKLGANTTLVEKQIETLQEKSIPNANEALDFLDMLLEDFE